MATQSLQATTDKRKHSDFQRLLNQWQARLRLSRLVLWLPRILMLAATLGLTLALLLAVLRLATLGQTVTLVLALVVLVTGVGVGVVLAGSRSSVVAAQRFDRLFGLQERVSTALELLSGRIQTQPELAERQITDAHTAAHAVNVRDHIKIEWRWYEWIGALVLFLALFVLFQFVLAPSAVDAFRPASAQAIQDAAETVRDITESVALESLLSPEERSALLETLEISLDDLQDPETSAEEAFANMNDLSDTLDDQAQQLQQEASAQAAAQQNAEQSLRNAPVPAASNQQTLQEMQDTLAGESAQQDMQTAMEQMTPDEREASAQGLEEAAAQQAEQGNQALAEAMERMAEAMRDGDTQSLMEAMQAAMQELQQAQSSTMQQQQSAQNLQAAAEQAQQAAQAIAQSAQQNAPQDAQQQQQSAEQGQPAGEQQQGEQSQPAQQSGDQQGEQGAQSQQSGDQQGEQGAQGQQSGEQQGQQAAQDGESASNAQAEAGQSSTSGVNNAGDSDSTQETTGAAATDQDMTSNNPDGTGTRRFEEIYAPQTLNADGRDEIRLEPDAGNAPIQEGDFQDNPIGEARTSYDQVYGDYADAANRALESDYVPLGLRAVVRQYFTSLEPPN